MRSFRLSAVVVALGLSACGAFEPPIARETRWVDGRSAELAGGRGALSVRWSQRIVPMFDDAYLPVETATPALDPERDRAYVASTTGTLWAIRGNGQRIYRYEAGVSFEAGPSLDPNKQELYAVSEDGVVHALNALTGAVRWKTDSGAGATREPVFLDADALYVVSEVDQVVALSRDLGEVLWRFKREPTDGYHMVGHAGVLHHGGRLFAAFSDGAVVAIDPGDGRAIWTRETALDFPPGEVGRGQRFVDVDTTPVTVADVLYVASFSGGLYGLDPRSGSIVSQRPDLIGITSLVAADADLIAAHADGRLTRLDPASGTVRWSRRISRGTAGTPVLAGDVVYVGETQGGFVARSAATGIELSRIESGHGFSAIAAVSDRRGFVLSNGGTLYALTLP